MSTFSEIAEVINSISEQKETLKNSFENLRSQSSHFPNLISLEWQDLDDHFSSIEKSIKDRFINISGSPPKAKAKIVGIEPRQQLRSLCVSMDSKHLHCYVSKNLKKEALLHDLAPAIRSAPDPALLVLDAMEGFPPASFPSSKSRRSNIVSQRKTCQVLLQILTLIDPVIKPSVREKAKAMAFKWKAKIRDGCGSTVLRVTGLLLLIMSFDLVSEFNVKEILNLLSSISHRKKVTELIEGLKFTEKLPVLIQKLNTKGRHIDSVGLIYAFNMVDKYPPVPLIEAYVTESKRLAQQIRDQGNNSVQSQNLAAVKEMAALKKVIKAVEEYKLEDKYPCGRLIEDIARLCGQKKSRKIRKRAASAAREASAKVGAHALQP